MHSNPRTPAAAVLRTSLLLACAALAWAQQPTRQAPTRTAPAGDVVLVPLRTFVGASVVHAEPLVSSPADASAQSGKPRQGTTHDVVVATVQDVVFGADGAIVSYVVEPPADPAKSSAPPATKHVLPVGEVRWDETSRALRTELDGKQILALPPYGGAAPKADAPPREPAPVGEQSAPAVPPATMPTFLASSLANAELRRGLAGDRVAERAATIWLAPGSGQLALLVVAQGAEHRLVPWHAVRAAIDGDRVLLDVATIADRIPKAPSVQNPNSPPDAASRAKSFRHFGLAAPAWETSAPRDGAEGQRGSDGERKEDKEKASPRRGGPRRSAPVDSGPKLEEFHEGSVRRLRLLRPKFAVAAAEIASAAAPHVAARLA